MSCTTNNQRAPHRGITLAEMLVVLVIVGILTALAAPSFNRSQGESRLDGDASKLGGDIQWTRLLATKSGKRSFLYLESAAHRWSLWLDRDGDLSFDATKDSLIKKDSLGNSIRFGLAFAAPATIAVLGTSVPASGFGGVKTGAVEDCLEATIYPAAVLGNSSWAYGSDGLIVGCGGSTADIGNGVLYLTTTKSDTKAYALVFNHVTSGSESFTVRRYKWTTGGTWVLQ